jgi:hypothetical protein
VDEMIIIFLTANKFIGCYRNITKNYVNMKQSWLNINLAKIKAVKKTFDLKVTKNNK